MRIASRKGSKYVEHLPDSAIVVTPSESKQSPCLKEIIVVATSSTSPLTTWIRQRGDVAEALGLQRKVKPERRKLYEDDIKANRMPEINLEITVYRDSDGTDITLLTDGRTRLEAASLTDWSGVLTIKVRYATSKDEAAFLICRFDSAESTRTGNERIVYFFGPGKDVSRKHIRRLNSGVQNTRLGCPDGDMSRIKECCPGFDRVRLISFESLTYLRDHHQELLKWFPENFNLGSGTGKYLNVGIFTAVILTRLVDGPESTAIWKRFVSGENLSGALLAFREEIRNSKTPTSGGQQTQTEMFHKALHAYLSEKQLFNAHITNYVVGQRWQISTGLITSPSPKHIRQTGALQKVKTVKVRKAA